MQLISKFLSYFIAVIFILFIIIFPDTSIEGVSRGLIISSNVIIPSLFPFMVCVLMLIKNDFCIKNRFVNKIIFIIFGHNFDMFFTFLLSMLGGYPVGARLINELYKQNVIDNKTADIMLMYCVNAGPAFIVSVVGIGVFGSQIVGAILLLSHITASFIIALLCSKKLKTQNVKCKNTIKNVKTFSENFIQSVADASASILQICSFVILFSSINAYLDLFFGDMPIIKYISFFTEITTAVTKTKNIFFISFLLGFSGISIWCQIFAMSAGRKVNLLKFCFGRIFHGLLSGLIAKVIISIFDIKLTIFSNNVNFKNSFFYSDISVSIALATMLIVFLVFLYTKNNSGKILKDVI